MEYKDDFLAKSDGTKMFEHSTVVNIISCEIIKQTLQENKKEEDIKHIIKHFSFLHDIGKISSCFQNKISNKTKKYKCAYLHNEIGWAFLTKYLSPSFRLREDIINLVYWHHGIRNKMNGYYATNVLEAITEEDEKNMLEYLISN